VVAVLETIMILPALYVGKIVHFGGVNEQVRGRHLPAIVVWIDDEGLRWWFARSHGSVRVLR